MYLYVLLAIDNTATFPHNALVDTGRRAARGQESDGQGMHQVVQLELEPNTLQVLRLLVQLQPPARVSHCHSSTSYNHLPQ